MRAPLSCLPTMFFIPGVSSKYGNPVDISSTMVSSGRIVNWKNLPLDAKTFGLKSFGKKRRDQTWLSPFRAGLASTPLVCSPVASKSTPPPRKTLGKKHNNHHHFRCNFSQDLLAPRTHATGLRAPLRSPMPALHSDSQVSSLRRNVM